MDTKYETSYGIFEWDEAKNEINKRKHKIDFKDAVSVFADPSAHFEHDYMHSQNEDRFQVTGCMRTLTIAAVFFTDRQNVTRIISARRATKNEREKYERNFRN